MRRFALMALLILTACDPPYRYEVESRVPQRVFPDVVITPHDAMALVGSHHFSPPIHVENRSDDPLLLVSATVTTAGGKIYESSEKVHPFYRTVPPHTENQIATTWFWDTAAVSYLGRRCEVRFVLENGDRRGELVVVYRRTR